MSLTEQQLESFQSFARKPVDIAKRRLAREDRERELHSAFLPPIDETGPTRERVAKGDSFERPEYTPEVKREAYRALHPFESLFKQGKIEFACKEAGMRLVQHIEGMMGSDVRVTGEPYIPADGERRKDEIPRFRHGEHLREARQCILSRNTKSCYSIWMAVEGFAKQTMSLEDIGRMWRKQNPSQARERGLAVIESALEDLAVLWKLSQSYHSRQPPNR